MALDNNTLADGLADGDDPAAQLVVISGGSSTRSVDLDGDTLTIGRQADNDLILDSERVSRRHARILRDGSRFFVEDLGSFNGTLLNDRRIEPDRPQALQHKDIVQLSDCRLLFLDHNVFATRLGLSIHLDRERVRKEADQALREFLAQDKRG